MDRTYAYVDESGNSDLDTSKTGSSGFFVVCSVLVAEKDLKIAYQRAEELRQKHFQTGEIKSSKLRPKDTNRRARILKDLAELPIKLYFVVVDKERIYKDGGLQFKTSFVKHINGILYSRLFRNCRDLQMTVDEHGGIDFQESLKAYAQDRYVDDLFGDEHAFQTKSSKEDVLIQVADFFAGSVAQIYENKVAEDVSEVYKSILSEQTLGLLEWPPKFKLLIPPPMDEPNYADYQVHQEALRQADRFIDQVGQHPDEDEWLQISILDYLRFQSEFVTKDYIPTGDILTHLGNRGFGDLSEQRVRSSGIAKLRDADVIITSTSKGYKIPHTRADINDFLEMASGVIVPLLERVKKAREVYRLSSRGEYDIIKTARLTDLEKLLKSLEAFRSE
ncbi:DUF3800 domain-containing protein [Pseudomonas sp. zfem002]|uniref:DUF3800 domain-containing protein n=1 Tax=Pseudomonas sp. zfem002 TaxID=3078197 RepID=UPI002929A9B0|nr:DUF3800 domain-containing protein [Pseudomonas sp. zfem002]MDU9389293.1 DUF3800 domain-containing protein [Pseudomonas sp. zfem002]